MAPLSVPNGPPITFCPDGSLPPPMPKAHIVDDMHFEAQLSMEQSYNVGISTLHGNIIHIDVEAQTLVKVFKQQCIDESQLDVAPLKINVDLAGLMNGSDKFTKWEGVRLVSLNDGALLDDDRSIGSQVALGHNVFMFKLVFMKQGWKHLSADERTMLAHFADGKKGVSGYILTLPPHDTPFVVMPLWGGVDRPEAILGVFYQHKATEELCSLMLRGVDPRGVDTKARALQVDFEVVRPSP